MNKYLRFKELKSESNGVEKFGVSFVDFSLVHNLKLNWDESSLKVRIDCEIIRAQSVSEGLVFFKIFESERNFISWRKEFAEFSKNQSMYFDLGIIEHLYDIN
jgi:hypothetical protein